jgi:hypothetical protein
VGVYVCIKRKKEEEEEKEEEGGREKGQKKETMHSPTPSPPAPQYTLAHLHLEEDNREDEEGR